MSVKVSERRGVLRFVAEEPPQIPTSRPRDDHIARFRPPELQRLIRERYGRKALIMQDDDGFALALAMLDTLARGSDACLLYTSDAADE